jgi:hypothetical protein
MELVQRYLEEDSVVHRARENGSLIEACFPTPQGLHFVSMQLADQATAFFVLVVRIPEVVPEARRREAAEVVVRANYGLAVGAFDLDMSDGELSFRLGFPVADAVLTGDQFRHAVVAALWTCDMYLRAFKRLLYGDDLSPVEVIAEVEMARK